MTSPSDGTDLVEEVAKLLDHNGTLDTADDAPCPYGSAWIANEKRRLRSEAANIIATITRLRLAAPVWREIETAPKDGTDIILACWGGTSDGELFPWWIEESNWLIDGQNEGWSLTRERHQAHLGSFPASHWMPLPPPTSQAAAVAGEDKSA